MACFGQTRTRLCVLPEDRLVAAAGYTCHMCRSPAKASDGAASLLPVCRMPTVCWCCLLVLWESELLDHRRPDLMHVAVK